MNAATVSMGYQYNPARQIKTLSLLNSTDPFYLPEPTASASTSFTPNALNEYGSINGGTSTYDNNGNLLSVPASATVPAQTYTYDTENHLVTASVPSIQSAAITYDYDGLGRRVSKTVGTTSTSYLLDADEEIAEYNGATLLRRYITGPAVDERIVHVEGVATTAAPTGSTHTYYHVNHQGSVIAVTDYTGAAASCLTGTACQRLAYDEYGNLSTGASAIGEAFRYTGRRLDPETGLYYYRARYYSPLLGRFLQPDPVGYSADLDLYTYVGNDPLDKTDPSGKYICVPAGPGRETCTSDGSVGDNFALFGHAIAAYWNSARQSISNALHSSSDKPSGSQDQGTAAADSKPQDKPAAPSATPSPPPAVPPPDDKDKARQKGERAKQGDDAQQKLEDITRAQRQVRQGRSNQIIDSIKKSEQRSDNALKPHNIDLDPTDED